MTQALLEILRNSEAIRSRRFEVIKQLSVAVNSATASEFESVEVQRLVLYALENRTHFGELTPILDSLIRARGLYPYVPHNLLGKELLAREAHRPLGLDDVVFHQEQSEVYLRLLRGENVVLSAPTSFGKSLIIDALIASSKYQNVAVIVPTIALIDETRRRLAKRFGERFKVITHASQLRTDANIYVMTQERALELPDDLKLDLFAIDEFYKLDPRRDSDRALLLNQAFYKLLRTGAQFYMLGPSIERIPEAFGKSLRSTFISTPYSTVVTEQVAVSNTSADAQEKLIDLCRNLPDATLIYCASPASARRVATALSAAFSETVSSTAEAARWVAENYHPDWAVARALLHGIGVHHGKVPRALGQFCVKAFNEGHLRFLICTSTLIEGVNTKAKNVIIFDNKVATKKLDFFTFNNIRGRSGRMFHHFVGRVFVFGSPPQNDLPFVDVPLVTQGEGTPDSLLIHLDSQDLLDGARDRMATLQQSSTLPLELLRSNSGIDPQSQMRLANELRSDGRRYFHLLNWTGFPDWEQLCAACDLIWTYFVESKRQGGVYSARQLAYRIDQLKKARSVRALILRELVQRDSPDADAAVEDVLDFVRTWASFHFPRYLMALDRIQREVFTDWVGTAGDYSAFAANVENLFTSSGLIALDEYGIPLQVAVKIAPRLRSHQTVDEAIAGLRKLDMRSLTELSDFERELVLDAKRGLGASNAEVL